MVLLSIYAPFDSSVYSSVQAAPTEVLLADQIQNIVGVYGFP